MFWRWLAVLGTAGLLIAGIMAWELRHLPLANQNQQHQQYYAHDKENPAAQVATFIAAIDRTIADHHDTVIALGTLAIAAFTGTLWWVTRGLRRFASLQAADMQQLLIAASTNAAAAFQQADAMRQLRNAAEAQERAMRAQAQATIEIAEATADAAEAAEATAEAAKATGELAAKTFQQEETLFHMRVRAGMRPGFFFARERNPRAGAGEIRIVAQNHGAGHGTLKAVMIFVSDKFPEDLPNTSSGYDSYVTNQLLAKQEWRRFNFTIPVKEDQYIYGFIRWVDIVGKFRYAFCMRVRPNRPSGARYDVFHEWGREAWNREEADLDPYGEQ